MKKITLLLLVLMAASSCLRREDPHSYKTAYGASILHEGATMAIAYSEFVMMAVEMDITAEAPTEKRDSLADVYFPYAKFRISGNTYSLTRDDITCFEVETDGQSLTTPNAKWSVTQYGQSASTTETIAITCLHSNSWRLDIAKTEQGTAIAFNSEIISYRKAIDATPRRSKFSLALTKSTLIEPTRHLWHELNTTTPLMISSKNFSPRYNTIYTYLNYPSSNSFEYEILGGAIVDRFVNAAKSLIEEVDADFSYLTPSSSFPTLRITYDGITEKWYWHDIPYYNSMHYC